MDLSAFQIRPGKPEDAPAIAGLFQTTYARSSHPCADPAVVAAGMAGGEVWMIAVLDGRVTACTALLPYRWNASYECGRSVTLAEFRRCGLGREVYRWTLLSGLYRDDCELIIGHPRSATMCAMVGGVDPPLVLVGHDGGANVADGRWEVHAVGLVGPARPIVRVPPPGPSPADLPPVADRIRALGFTTESGPYPSDLLAGPPGEHVFQCPAGRLSFRVSETPYGPTAHLTAAGCNTSSLRELISCFLEEHLDLAHVACDLLADKQGEGKALRSFGFDRTAYLPGWALYDGRRYDCVRHALRRYPEAPSWNGLEAELGPLADALR